MNRFLLRKVDLLVLREFVPLFVAGVAGFTLLMVAALLFRDMVKYVTDYHLSLGQVGVYFVLALPQIVAYTLPMAILFAGLLAFGRLSESSQITAVRAGGVGFLRIVFPALVFAWFVVLGMFLLNEKVAPQSTKAAKQFIRNSLIDRGLSDQETNISYMDQDAGWLFAAASGEGNVFKDVRWWDFSRPGEITLYAADEGVWSMGGWEFHNAKVINLSIGKNGDVGKAAIQGEEGLENLAGRGNVIRSMVTSKLEMKIARTPSDILNEGNRDPQEMSLGELKAYISSPAAQKRSEEYIRKIEGTYYFKIAAPFASIIFTLIAAPLGLTPQRSSSTMGVGLSMLLVFAYYLLSAFSVKTAESGVLTPVVAAWLPNAVFLVAGIFLNARFYMKSA